MRVHVVDPSAYTPPYDHALCSALAAADTEVELFTSRFPYGPQADPDGYVRHEFFYRAAVGAPGGRARTVSKLAQHVPDMLRYRRAARSADVVHFQWLPVQHLDGHLLPFAPFAGGGGRFRWGAARFAGGGGRSRWDASARSVSGEGWTGRVARRAPLVLTAHDVLPREPRPGQLAAQRRLYDRFDAIVVHSEHGRARLIEELGADGERVHVIPHGVFTHLAEREAAPLPAKPGRLVVLMFGLMRPYKGIDVLLDAWRGAEKGEMPIDDAELWIVGMPRMDISALRAAAPENVRFVPRFVRDDELAAYFERADLVVLPYLQADQSGVLFTALAFGKPLLLSDVGGFPEMASTGAARIVAAGDPRALGQALRELLVDRATLTEMCVRARAAVNGRYSWEAIAAAHLELYERLLQAGSQR
ncbi:MAG TPA: glycosyltransferase family 4 protein [Solirubrobacteraceae bacterium]